MTRDDARLALHRRLGLEARPGERHGEPSPSLVLVQVAGLELDDVDLAALPQACEVLFAQDCPLAQVRAEVVDEHASFYVSGGGGTSVKAKCFHQLRG
ncbi:MAG: hypothetical protein E6I29_09405 [Chloroflexi bacterium]|nr:MAG: hypothetical protein E6I41_03795 [Chloroflexota bacterium]TMF29018.1 MAG: hypothetical protein E6I29_09405 [Chloroflexota bacterium]